MKVTHRLGRRPTKAFGRTVYMTMFDKRIKQTALARETGIEQSLLSKKLHGKRPWTLDELIRVADALRVDARDLLGQMWGEPGEPNTATRRNNPCYYDGTVTLGPWPDSQTPRAA